MQTVPSFAFTCNYVLPIYGEDQALETGVNLAPATFFAAGTVLGNITSLAQDVQTFTATGTPTGGAFAFSVSDPRTGVVSTLSLAFGETSTTLQPKLNAIYGVGQMVAGGGAWPGTALTMTANSTGQLSGLPIAIAAAGANTLSGGTSPAASVAHTTTGRTAATYGAYASGNSDGSQVAKCVLKYDCTTDASGRIIYGNLPTGTAVVNLTGFYGESQFGVPAYFRGDFDVTKLVGLDSTAATALGKMLSGVAAGPGILRIT